MGRMRGMYIVEAESFDRVYGPAERAAIEQHIDMAPVPQTRESVTARPGLLRDVDVIVGGWGMPVVDEAFLKAAPKLRAIFYGAGAIGYFATPAMWDRGIVVTTATTANSIPVAEYTLATILFSLKHGWSLARQTRESRCFVPRNGAPGCYQRTVGLISLGAVARTVLRLLKPFDLKVIAYDPFIAPRQASQMGVELVELNELFRQSDVVSLHTPLLPETRGLITGLHLNSMKPGATFINTARGEVVRENEMIDVLSRRADLHAVIDVCEQEPPVAQSKLYTLPNVTLTPHIAGSVGDECRRMGRHMVEEVERWIRGEPLRWAVTPAAVEHSAHGPVLRPAHLIRPVPIPPVAGVAVAI